MPSSGRGASWQHPTVMAVTMVTTFASKLTFFLFLSIFGDRDLPINMGSRPPECILVF